jgi:hypothetical protein
MLGFTPLGCDIYRISKEFSDLIFTDMLEIQQPFKWLEKLLYIADIWNRRLSMI